MSQFANEMILVLFKFAVNKNNAPCCLKHRPLLPKAEFIIYVIGKLKKIYSLTPFAMSQFKQIFDMVS